MKCLEFFEMIKISSSWAQNSNFFQIARGIIEGNLEDFGGGGIFGGTCYSGDGQ